MFSNNDKISPRQIKRLLMFDLFGASSLLLPTQLAKTDGSAGVWSVFAGLLLAGCYLWLVQTCCAQTAQDYLDYLQNGWGRLLGRLFYICYAFVSMLVSAWTAKLLAELVCDSLLENREFPAALLLILLLALYGGIAGIEARARIYEILFWVLAIPVLIMLLLCIRQIQVVRWFPLLPEFGRGKETWSGLWKGSMQCFLLFLPLTFLLFLKPHEHEGQKNGRTAAGALFLSGAAVAVLYLFLVGIFGSEALAMEQYPVITLMGMIKIPGDFVKRLDTVMIGVWFFTLYALIAAALYYSVVVARRAITKQSDGSDNAKSRNGWFWLMALTVYGIAYGFHRYPESERLAGSLFYLAGVPFLVLVPMLSIILCRIRRQKERGQQCYNKSENYSR